MTAEIGRDYGDAQATQKCCSSAASLDCQLLPIFVLVEAVGSVTLGCVLGLSKIPFYAVTKLANDKILTLFRRASGCQECQPNDQNTQLADRVTEMGSCSRHGRPWRLLCLPLCIERNVR
jgi:hypothetical protein